jgi:type I restriction enzyme M protein
MADEYSRPPYSRNVAVPQAYAWPTLRALTGAALEAHYLETLRALGALPGMLGQIFTKAQNKIQDPAKLARLVGMIDEEQWVMLDADVTPNSSAAFQMAEVAIRQNLSTTSCG